jgi:hypothetical protein
VISSHSRRLIMVGSRHVMVDEAARLWTAVA